MTAAVAVAATALATVPAAPGLAPAAELEQETVVAEVAGRQADAGLR